MAFFAQRGLQQYPDTADGDIMGVGDFMLFVVDEDIKEPIAIGGFGICNRVSLRKAFFAAAGDHSWAPVMMIKFILRRAISTCQRATEGAGSRNLTYISIWVLVKSAPSIT